MNRNRPSWCLSESTENAIICGMVVLAGVYLAGHILLAGMKA